MDQSRTFAVVGTAAVPITGPAPFQLLLPGGAGVGHQPEIYAADGRGVYAASFLRRAADDRLVAEAGPVRRAQTGAAVAAPDGLDGRVSQAAFESESAVPSAVCLPAQG